MRLAIITGSFLLCLVLVSLYVTPVYAEKRVALIIGNGNYTEAPSLKTSINDALEIEKVLCQVGFTVTSVINANYADMKNEVKAFGKKLNNNTVALFYYSGHAVQYIGNGNKLGLWNLDSGKFLYSLNAHTKIVGSVSFSQNGHYALSGSGDETIRLWKWKTSKSLLRTLTGHSGAIRAVSFSKTGQQILSGSYDKTLRVWDFDGNTKRILKGHSDVIMSVAFSPNGRYALSGSRDKTMRLWDINIVKM